MEVLFNIDDQTGLDRIKAKNYGITLIQIQKAYLNNFYDINGRAAIYTSCSSPIRYIQEHIMVQAPLTNRAMHRANNFGIPTSSHLNKTDLKKLSRRVKRAGNLTNTPFRWEHIISVKSITDKILQADQIDNPQAMIDLVKSNTLIVIKDIETEQNVRGEGNNPISIEELERWNDDFAI